VVISVKVGGSTLGRFEPNRITGTSPIPNEVRADFIQ